MIGRVSFPSPRRACSRPLAISFLLLGLFVTLASDAAPVRAQALDANRWVTDGDVRGMAPWGNTLYVGGDFTYIGPNTGGMVALDDLGSATNRMPRVDGDVTAVVGDDAGGWFIAGSFTHVAGIARPGLARILADGSVSAWSPNPVPSGGVACLEHDGTRLFVATQSPDYGENLIAYEDATGARIVGWTPQITGNVLALAVYGTTLFAGGGVAFPQPEPDLAGSGMAAFNTNTAAIETFNAATTDEITGLYIHGQWLYATGSFTSIGGQDHPHLARMLLSTREFDSNWNPDVDSPVKAMAIVGDKLWIGGDFIFVNGEFRDRIAVMDTTTGLPDGLVPNLSAVNGTVGAIAPRAGQVYIGLAPYDIFPAVYAAQPMVIRMSAASGLVDAKWQALGWAPSTGIGRAITGLRLMPTGWLATGTFISTGGQRHVGVAALDRATGEPRAWDPGLASTSPFPNVLHVSSIVPTRHAIYIGGHFSQAGGQPRRSLAALDSANGRAQAWRADLGTGDPELPGTTHALALFQDKLVVGGSFTTIKDEAHANLAQVDTVTGVPVPGWSADVSGTVHCLLVRADRVFAGGAFTHVGGAAHAHLAAVTASTGAVLTWDPNVQGISVRALASANDTIYVGGDFSNVGAQMRFCLAMVSANSAALLGWAPAAFGPVRALQLDGPNIVVGGEFEFIVGQPLAYLAKLQRVTGALVNGSPVTDAKVLALALDGGSLDVGGSFGRMAQSPTAYLARVGGADGAGPGVQVVAANGGEYLVVGTTYRHEYTATDPSGVASVDVELSRTGAGGPWTLLAAGLRNTGHYEWAVTGPNAASSAFLRVTARDFAGNLANDASNLAFTIGGPTTDVQPGHAGALGTLVLGPNPARIRTDLRFTLAQPTRVMLRLLDVQGREMWAAPERAFEAGEHALPLELEGIRPGLYFLRHDLGRGSQTARLVVIR